MTDTELLKRKIHESGLKYGYIAEKVGISRTSLYLKVNGDKAFNQSEISILCELLPIENLEEKEHIFFTHQGNKNATIWKKEAIWTNYLM